MKDRIERAHAVNSALEYADEHHSRGPWKRKYTKGAVAIASGTGKRLECAMTSAALCSRRVDSICAPKQESWRNSIASRTPSLEA